MDCYALCHQGKGWIYSVYYFSSVTTVESKLSPFSNHFSFRNQRQVWRHEQEKSLVGINLDITNLGAFAWTRQSHPTPVLLPGKSHGRKSLEDCSPCGRWESDTTERLHFHVSLSCIGERNGNPLQCSCLENPRDGGAWWAAFYGVTQSQTRLKRLSSSSILVKGSKLQKPR